MPCLDSSRYYLCSAIIFIESKKMRSRTRKKFTAMRPLCKHLKEMPVLNVVKCWALIGMFVLLFAMISPLMHPVYAASGDWPTYLMENGRSGYNGAETIINAT